MMPAESDRRKFVVATRATQRSACAVRALSRKHPGEQRGAALLVALVLVLISTLVGISVMETSGIETRLVANESYRQTVFNVAEATAERAFNTVDAGVLPEDGSTQTTTVPEVDSRVTVDTEARLESVELAVGFSAGRFENVRYRLSATASVPEIGATHTVHLGASNRGIAQGATR